jgi:flagellum-specific peptidoglycan hydrolase FlgJ
VHSASKPWWQQVTALVSLSAGGAITGFSFAPKVAADVTSPTSVPMRLLALDQSAQPAPADDTMLRSAIVNVANYYLRMAEGKTSAEMQALIWQHDSIDGVDHGASCAAFASLTLELAAQVVGQQSWVTGGSSYPWPLHEWADVRVDPNPASLGVISILQDAQAHQRWHPLGDGYQPRPGDWVLFDGHVEVVTEAAGGVLHTVGGDSLPDFSINAHEYSDPLGAQGVVGFVNNGQLSATAATAATRATGATGAPHSRTKAPAGHQALDQAATGLAAIPGAPAVGSPQPTTARAPGGSAFPGRPSPAPTRGYAGPPAPRRPWRGLKRTSRGSQPPHQARPGKAISTAAPGASRSGPAAPNQAGTNQAGTNQAGTVAIPGLPITAHALSVDAASPSTTPYRRHDPSSATTPVAGTSAQQEFIGEVARGAVAAQRKYGIPAAVTIAQAIDESGWGLSNLAANDNNLFGIKGTGPAGSDPQSTQEYQNGQLVTRAAAFRVYHTIAESIDDHGRLLATSEYYTQAMADRQNPNAFAAALTGVYATDPDYGAKLISLMRRYNLYRYDVVAPGATLQAVVPGAATVPGAAAIPGLPDAAPTPPVRTSPPAPSHAATHGPGRPSYADRPSSGATPSTQAPSTRAPSTRAPSTRAPSTQAPSTHAPSTRAPSTQAPSSQAPSTQAPSTPAPSTRAPSTQAPSTQAPSAPASSPQAPSTPAPSTPAPSTHAPSTPAPSTPAASTQAPSTPAASSQAPSTPAASSQAPSTQAMSARPVPVPGNGPKRRTAPRRASASTIPYRQHIPPSVTNDFNAMARAPLVRAQPLYRDVASYSGIRWELLAACDWMQCKAQPRYSPVCGEKLGTVNPDGMIYRTKSEALEQCADDLVELAEAVYQIDLTAPGNLSVRDLANVFAAFRWGGLLKLHHTSAMEFPYSVAGLTIQHINMRWPNIDEPNAPDKPGGRFRMPFGAVPIILGLNYKATV